MMHAAQAIDLQLERQRWDAIVRQPTGGAAQQAGQFTLRPGAELRIERQAV